MMRRVDLLPAIHEQRRLERRNFVVVVVAGLMVLLLLIGWWVVLGFKINSAENVLADRQAQNLQLQQQIAELSEFADLESEVQAKKSSLQTVMAGDLDWPALMTEIAMVIPDDVWLGSLTASAGTTTGATTAPTETNAIDIDPRQAFGRILFEGHALSMRAVANWLIRQETVDEFLAVYLGSSTDSEFGGQTTFDFSNTIELGEKAISGRFQEDDIGEGDNP
jgi:Tfp pilus assembly protein PilN